MQCHPRASRLTLDVFDREFALARRLPAHARVRSRPGTAGFDGHLVRDNESRIKTNTKLSDQVCVVLLVARHLLQELGGSGLGDGTEVVDQFVTGHADAVVDDGQGTIFLVNFDANAKFGIVVVQLRIGQRLEAQLVGRIGGIGDQLTQKDLFVAVKGMDHQLQ